MLLFTLHLKCQSCTQNATNEGFRFKMECSDDQAALILLGIYAISFVPFTFCRPLMKHLSHTPSHLQHGMLRFNLKYHTTIFQRSIRLSFLLLTAHRTYIVGKQILLIHPSFYRFRLVHFISTLMNCMNNLSVQSHTDAFSYRHRYKIFECVYLILTGDEITAWYSQFCWATNIFNCL